MRSAVERLPGRRILPSYWALVLFGCLLSAPSESAAREGLWQRTRSVQRGWQQEAWQAAERTLNGNSDEMDLLKVRTALVDLSRGTLFEPRAVLSLLELRRQLGLPAPANGEALLAEALAQPMSRYDRARAHLISAQMLLQQLELETHFPERRQQEQRAAEQLEMATSLAWERHLRARVLIVRSLLALARGEPESCTQLAFSASRLVETHRQQIQVQAALALGHAALGRTSAATEAAVSIAQLEGRRREASGIDALAALPLSDAERSLSRDALSWLATSRRRPLEKSEIATCHSLLEDPAHPRFLRVRPELSYALRALMTAACPTDTEPALPGQPASRSGSMSQSKITKST